jgi:hypothetical protein
VKAGDDELLAVDEDDGEGRVGLLRGRRRQQGDVHQVLSPDDAPQHLAGHQRVGHDVAAAGAAGQQSARDAELLHLVEPAPADVARETLQLKQMDPRGEVHGRLVHTRH